MGETDRQRRAREASHRYFAEALARMFDPDRKNRTPGRIIDLWDARRALAGPSRYSIRQLAAPSAPGGRGSHATVLDAVSSARSICVGSIVIPALPLKA